MYATYRYRTPMPQIILGFVPKGSSIVHTHFSIRNRFNNPSTLTIRNGKGLFFVVPSSVWRTHRIQKHGHSLDIQHVEFIADDGNRMHLTRLRKQHSILCLKDLNAFPVCPVCLPTYKEHSSKAFPFGAVHM